MREKASCVRRTNRNLPKQSETMLKQNQSGVQQTVPVTEHNVLDRGSLLHRLKWKEGSTYSLIPEDYVSFTVENYGRATVVFDGYEVGPSIKDCAHQRQNRKLNVNKVNITEATIFSGKKDDFLSNGANKQALIQLIMERMKQKEYDVIQAEEDADVEIAKAVISMSAFRPTSLIGEDIDLLVLLLFHTDVSKCTALYFRSDKVKSYVYDIKVLKQVLGEAVCNELLFLHAFTGCDLVSRVFGIGKKSGFQRIIKREKNERLSKSILSTKANAGVVETIDSKAMITLFNGDQKDSLASIRYNMLCKKVARAKMFVTPE